MFPFRFRTPRRKPPPLPSWLKWLMLAFVGYALLVGSMPGSRQYQGVQRAKENIRTSSTPDIAQYKDRIFPEHAAGLRISDTEQGSGMPAVCGQEVRVSYQSYLAQGTMLPDRATAEQPLTFTIGDGRVMPAFDRGVIGMKKGGKRAVIAPPLMSYGLEDYRRADVPEGAVVRIEMELLHVTPPLPDAERMPYRMADVTVGRGMPVACGQEVAARLSIWDIRGALLYSASKQPAPFVFTPGRGEVMLGLEHGVLGMSSGGKRVLIIPPALQRTLRGAVPKQHFSLPKGETILVEVRLE